VSLLYLMLGLVILQRLAELRVARRNSRRLLAEGAIEHGSGHYPLIVALHAGWLLAMALTIPPDRPADPWLLAAFLLLQPARIWVIASLGRFWTTRVIVLPGAPRVGHGPYRWLAHPNYLIVALEIPLLPLAFAAWPLALAFGLANLALLAHRIRVEERALTAAAG